MQSCISLHFNCATALFCSFDWFTVKIQTICIICTNCNSKCERNRCEYIMLCYDVIFRGKPFHKYNYNAENALLLNNVSFGFYGNAIMLAMGSTKRARAGSGERLSGVANADQNQNTIGENSNRNAGSVYQCLSFSQQPFGKWLPKA